MAVVSFFKLDPKVYDKTVNFLKTNASYQTRLNQKMLEVELEERLKLMGPDYKPLEKAAALKHITNIE